MSDVDYYKILGVPRDATADQIRTAHRAAVRRVHPDTAEDGQGNPKQFAVIQQAYETLSVPDLRRRYDNKQATLRGERSGAGRRRPPTAKCAKCGKQVIASQLIRYLGRLHCQKCYQAKKDREQSRPRLSSREEFRWRLRQAVLWAQSNVMLIVIVIIALLIVGARVVKVMLPSSSHSTAVKSMATTKS